MDCGWVVESSYVYAVLADDSLDRGSGRTCWVGFKALYDTLWMSHCVSWTIRR